jgi:hypothetical protein
LIGIRDSAPLLGLIRDYSALNDAGGVEAAVLSVLPEIAYLGEFAIRGIEVPQR